jgi:hypothetical protein
MHVEVAGNPAHGAGIPTAGELNGFFKKSGQFRANDTVGLAGLPSSTGLDGRLSDTSGRRTVKSLRNFAGVSFALAEVAMFNIRLSRSVLSLDARSAARPSVCADSGFGVGL